jgi:YidC/Oxa1 family membrane protein insertase
MVALAVFQALLDGIGWVLARIYDVVGNYGVAIIVLTIAIMLVLLPLGIKQIKSMQAMQAIQPKVKDLQKKYKGDKQRVQEETMKLYKEAGVNPLGGCLPLLLQLPILFAMYAVLRAPVPNAAYDPENPQPNVPAYLNNHLPTDSQLYEDITTHKHTDFLWMNLQCSPSQSGKQAVVPNSAREPSGQTLDCGSTTANRIPYFAFLAVMIGTTYFQQRQMQKASPPGASSQQQQLILRLMPIMIGFFGYTFPSGLVLYWTTSNLWRIGQQWGLLKAGHIGPEAMERRLAEQRARGADQPAKQGFFARMMDQVQQSRQGEEPPKPARGKPAGGRKPAAGGSRGGSGGNKSRRPNTGGTRPRRPNDPRKRRSGGSGGTGDGEAGA